MQTATVNTDFLKNILGIGQSEGKEKTIQNKPPYTAKNPVATIPTLTSQANTVRNSSNVSFDMLAVRKSTQLSLFGTKNLSIFFSKSQTLPPPSVC